MFEEMHRAMAEAMEVRQAMMDRMFVGFGPSMFPSFPSLIEDFTREFEFPGLTLVAPSVIPSLSQTQPQLLQQQQAQPVARAPAAAGKPPGQQQQQEKQKQAPSTLGSSVMYSSEQYYNSADPKQNYSRHTTTQAGPSGVLESRTAMRDHGEGVERVEVRRQLGDRYTQMGRKRRLDTGEETVEKRGHNLSNEEMEQFEQEWLKLAKENLPLYVHQVMAGLPLEQAGQPQPPPQQLEQQKQQSQSQAHQGGNIPTGKPQAQAQPTAMQHEQ